MSASTIAQIKAQLMGIVDTAAEGRRREQKIGEIIRRLDEIIELLRGIDAEEPGAASLLAQAMDERAVALEHMRMLNPDQAWFWTEESQAIEREIDRNKAEGRTLGPFNDEEFDAFLREVRPNLAEV